MTFHEISDVEKRPYLIIDIMIIIETMNSVQVQVLIFNFSSFYAQCTYRQKEV